MAPDLHVIFGTGPVGCWTARALRGQGKQVRAVNKDAAEFEDYAASLLLPETDPQQWRRGPGYVSFVGKFEADTQDHGVGNGVYAQFGTLSEIVRVTGRSPMSERAERCAKERDCVVSYRDGDRARK